LGEGDRVIDVGRYRVWCLSWEDDEENGSDVIVYDILTHDLDRREKRVIYVSNVSVFDLSDVVEAYADYANSHREGYESSWPLRFRARCPGGSTYDFEVDRQIVPQFKAHPIQSAEEAEESEGEVSPPGCPHCIAGEPSVWDDVLGHYAHPGNGDKLKFCHNPWRARCRACSADVEVGAEACDTCSRPVEQP
jgi:hypothetical protein